METSKDERMITKYLFVIGALISVVTVSFTQAEDMGIFLTVSSLVSKGYKLYSEIFEIKDPVFFYTAAGMIKIFGIPGAFMIDLILITISPIISFFALRNLEFSREVSFASSILFTLALTGAYYQSFRTQILAILILLFIIVISGKKNFLVGIFLSIMIFTKLNFILFIPFIILIVYLKSKTIFKDVKKISLGFISNSLILIGFMQARNEFIPYLKMVKTNFRYAENYQKIVGLPDGIIGHFELWNSNNKSMVYFIYSVLLNLIIWKKGYFRSLSKIQISALISINVTSVMFIALTNFWPHHLQFLSISALLNFAIIFQSAQDIKIRATPQKILNNRKDLTTFRGNTIGSTFLFILVILCAVNFSGLTVPTGVKMNLNKWIVPNWTVPPEIISLNSIERGSGLKIKVARLGMNDDLGYGAFLDTTKYQFMCSRPAITGFETKGEITRFLSCVANNVDVLTIGPMFESVTRQYGNYTMFTREAKIMLSEKFECNSSDSTGYRICLRKPVN